MPAISCISFDVIAGKSLSEMDFATSLLAVSTAPWLSSTAISPATVFPNVLAPATRADVPAVLLIISRFNCAENLSWISFLNGAANIFPPTTSIAPITLPATSPVLLAMSISTPLSSKSCVTSPPCDPDDCLYNSIAAPTVKPVPNIPVVTPGAAGPVANDPRAKVPAAVEPLIVPAARIAGIPSTKEPRASAVDVTMPSPVSIPGNISFISFILDLSPFLSASVSSSSANGPCPISFLRASPISLPRLARS